MFVVDSLFKATSPQPPSVVFIGFHLLEQAVVPDGDYVHVFSEDGGELSITKNVNP